jgi:hypothetical protein
METARRSNVSATDGFCATLNIDSWSISFSFRHDELRTPHLAIRDMGQRKFYQESSTAEAMHRTLERIAGGWMSSGN